MHCPVCKTHLRVIDAADLELDQCPDCHGIWFDKNELRPFIEFALEHRDDIVDAEYDTARLRFSVPGGDEHQWSCPACHGAMTKFHYAVDSNVVVDRCPICEGLWLERGDVSRLTSFFKGDPNTDRANEVYAAFVSEHGRVWSGIEGLRDFMIRFQVALSFLGIGSRG